MDDARGSMGLTAAVAVGLAFVLDAAFEELSDRLHPVAWLGRLIAPLDRAWTRPRAVGTVVALVLPVAFALALSAPVALVALAPAPCAAPLAAALAGLVLFATTSLRMLVSAANGVVRESETAIEAGRESLLALAGRDASDLSAGELRSAAVESAAENLADGLVAPLLAFALGAQLSLAVGCTAAAWVKGVNTLDSMLGYRSKPVGWASARLDDAVMWFPARASAALVALARPAPRALARARRWARTPPSPNSGWPMATLAVAIDVELTKPGVYTLNPDAHLPTPERARLGVRTVTVAGVLAFALTALVVGVSA
jgi:adenosylcobinamide-phosphate synthase